MFESNWKYVTTMIEIHYIFFPIKKNLIPYVTEQ
jgi:hypothetical protein